jgi:transcriptional regulator with XRE-family HTH domain
MRIIPLGDRLRILREAKNLLLVDLEESTGTSRWDLLQIECGNMAPTAQTLKGWAVALAIPVSQLICDKGISTPLSSLSKRLSTGEIAWRSSPKQLSLVFQIHRFLFWIRGIYRNNSFLWQTNPFHRSVEPTNHRRTSSSSYSDLFQTEWSRPHPANIVLAGFGCKSAPKEHASRDTWERSLPSAKRN